MQNFSLFLLLIIASMSFAFEVQAIAQESIENPIDKEMMGDNMEEIMDKELTDDHMMEDAMEETIESPLKQLMEGTDPHEIQCKSDQKLVFKASNWRPTCINKSSYDVLLSRGWISSHDPSHKDLMNMVENILKLVGKEPDGDKIEIKEDVVVEEESIPRNNEAEPQSYTIELREDIEMGAQ